MRFRFQSVVNSAMKQTILRLCTFLVLSLLLSAYTAPDAKPEYYELRTYYLNGPEGESQVDTYLQQALLPALHRQKITRVGVFKPIGNDTAATRRILVFIPFRKMEQFLELERKLQRDAAYQSAGQAYLQAEHNKSPYKRIESVLMKAFSLSPVAQKPALTSPVSDRVYELRSYEAATERLYRNKVEMFNEGGEISIFNRLGFNSIFYGEVLSGPRMPNLIYMTSFENMDERNKHWKTFGDDPEWQKLRVMPNYQNNVSKADIHLLRTTAYSDL